MADDENGGTRAVTLKRGPAYTNFTLRVSAFTNVQNWRVPLFFEMPTYTARRSAERPERESKNWSVNTTASRHGTTLKVSRQEPVPASFLPDVPPATLVNDLRRKPAHSSNGEPPYLINGA